jgi:hypothetical protein
MNEATLHGARHPTYADARMKDIPLALLPLAVWPRSCVAAVGVCAVMAENLLLKQQLIVLRRGRRRAPHLTPPAAMGAVLMSLSTIIVAINRCFARARL